MCSAEKKTQQTEWGRGSREDEFNRVKGGRDGEEGGNQ